MRHEKNNQLQGGLTGQAQRMEAEGCSEAGRWAKECVGAAASSIKQLPGPALRRLAAHMQPALRALP